MDEAHISAAALERLVRLSGDLAAIPARGDEPALGRQQRSGGRAETFPQHFGAGVTPVTVDRPAIQRIEAWMRRPPAPRYPGAVDEAVARKGEALFTRYCAACHGRLATPAPLQPETAHPRSRPMSRHRRRTPRRRLFTIARRQRPRSGPMRTEGRRIWRGRLRLCRRDAL